jgi:hypothetical protein
MPEIKHQFTGGKMEKDLDERLVPNGQYRDAMNIQVATSEGSEVGTVQNILGNRQILLYGSFELSPSARTIGCVSDEKNDTLYYLVWDFESNTQTTHNYVMSYLRGDSVVRPVFVDHNNILGFKSNTLITGINIIDDMLFWTDNKTEPKKINIPRSRQGTPTFNNHTKFINKGRGFTIPFNSPEAEEKHITVIKKGPNTPLRLQLGTSRNPDKIYTGIIDIVDDDAFAAAGGTNLTNPSSFRDLQGNTTYRHNFNGITTEDGSNKFNIRIMEGITSGGAIIDLGFINDNPDGPPYSATPGLNGPGLTGWHKPIPDYSSPPNYNNINIGTKIVLKPFVENSPGVFVPPGLPITDYVIKGVVEDYWYGNDPNNLPANPGDPWPQLDPFEVIHSVGNTIRVKVLAIDGFIPTITNKFAVDLWDETEKLFEFKFPRFSYRYKYEDGEYSTFAPWTPVAFQPGAFDYHPRKGYNLGMTNRVNKVDLFGLVNSSTPKDVMSIDILFKDEPSPNIYVVDTIRPDDSDVLGALNKWNSILNGNPYSIEKETINSVVPSNQLLRPWDNVPRKALAQDVTGNRIVYGNYVQNYDLFIVTGTNLQKYVPQFTFEWGEYEEFEYVGGTSINTRLSGTGKSIKSLREYQLGVVFVDKYGRETPVISNETGTKKLEKGKADKYNRINVSINTNSGFPNHEDLKYFKFYLKETSGEYYNMAMDRWYDAEDGNVWLAFPSSDRNKVDIDTFLILKKGTDTDDLVTDAARYKVIAIENQAPDFIKTKRQLAVSIEHSTTKDMYGTTLGDGPIQGRDSFELNYKAFLTTPGMHLDEYKEGKLYIEWENPITKQVSDRYEIVSIDNDYLADIGAGAPILDNAVYSIQLAENLGDDVNFITDDPSGVNSNFIRYGVKTNIYKYTVENRPQFDGRFFVKIYEDETFQANVEKSFKDGLGYRILNSKKVFYMKPLHKAIHTKNIDDFLVSGNLSSPADLEDITDDIGRDSGYGYYEIREFASMALFFRRYAKSALLWSGNTNYTTQLLAHLRPGTAVTNNANAGDLNGWDLTDISGVDLNMTYLGESWTPATSWNHEYGAYHPWSQGYTNWFDTITLNVVDAGSFFSHAKKTETVHEEADNARDTEVWFIDAGPYAGSAYDYTGNGDFKWSDMGRFEQYPGGVVASASNNDSYYDVMNPAYIPADVLAIDDINTSADNIRLNKGIVNAANTHAMTLAFGGIKGAANNNSSPGFFNIGNWNTSGGAVNNNNYPNLDDFVANFNSGIKFRWKQDPTQTIYTIGGNITSSGHLRHSTSFSQTIASWATLLNGSATSVPGFLDVDPGATSMAELLSFNFTKNWTMKDITPAYGTTNWYPLVDGKIPNSLEITLKTCSWAGTLSSGATATGSTVGEDLRIFVTDIVGTSNYTGNETLKVGMAFSDYTNNGGASGTAVSVASLTIANDGNDFLVIRRIETLVSSAGATYYALTLGGYSQPLRNSEHLLAIGSDQPKINTDIKFVQVGMNGYSPNSEFNINTMAHASTSIWGAVTAVGYDIEFIEFIEPEEILSENPAIFETEPKELPELDIYYEASADIPMVIDEDTVSAAFPVGSVLENASTSPSIFHNVVGYDGNRVLVQPTGVPTGLITCLKQDGVQFQPTIDNIETVVVSNLGGLDQVVTLDALGDYDSVEFSPNLYDLNYKLNWHNCYSFGNGVESNRIRDNFNLPYIMNGVKVSTTLEYDYKEEHRKYGLIYSGLYNAISGVNNLNQFIQAEKITKDINPIYGSIQKLHARDADLLTLCEDKILKILSQKDALYNADGNINLTATERVLGQAIPFAGEYGVSTNPESFASENYRAYFADRVRGAVLRLSMDGLTPISDAGMKDWFRDNLKLVNDGRIIGSYDDRNDEYVLKLESPIYGCINPSATNYNHLATVDDGSCIIPGCTDPLAFNYDPLATDDDNSCTYTTGCTDPLAFNYNPLATIDDGSCIAVVLGCTNPIATNYNAAANTDNGSCLIPYYDRDTVFDPADPADPTGPTGPGYPSGPSEYDNNNPVG